MNGIGRFLPLLIVVILVVVFFKMMTGDHNPKEIKSVMIGKAAPEFSIANLVEGQTSLTQNRLKTGKPVLVNFFASWCLPCRAEHENLVKIATLQGIEIIGIAYKDEPQKSRNFLEELGNPYAVAGIDQNGRIAIDWGVSGVPETFVVDGDGIIRYRHWGPIVGDSLEKRLLPKIEEAR